MLHPMKMEAAATEMGPSQGATRVVAQGLRWMEEQAKDEESTAEKKVVVEC